MALRKRLVLIAFVITLVLLSVILLIGQLMNNSRKNHVNEQMQIIADITELQTYSLMADVYGDKMACLAFSKKLEQWDNSLWDLGSKIDKYRIATEEFQKDPFYLEQKREFNENEVLYLMFLTKVNKECELNQHIITFFYRNSDDCRKCDDQSFILTDIKQEYDEKVAIFALDMDLNISNINILNEYYGITEYPCIVINERKYCGIRDKDFIIEKMCEAGNCDENITA